MTSEPHRGWKLKKYYPFFILERSTSMRGTGHSSSEGSMIAAIARHVSRGCYTRSAKVKSLTFAPGSPNVGCPAYTTEAQRAFVGHQPGQNKTTLLQLPAKGPNSGCHDSDIHLSAKHHDPRCKQKPTRTHSIAYFR